MNGLKVLTRDDFIPIMEEHHDLDGRPGLDTGFKCLNEFYTHKEGGVTDWTGTPGSGKTYFALEIMFGLAENYGKRTFLYVPDLGSRAEIGAKLLKMKTGLDMDSKYGRKIEKHKISQAMEWILYHFVVVDRDKLPSGKRAPKPDPLKLWEMGCKFKDENGEVDQILIDSWKNMRHIYEGREDQYLDHILSERNEMAEDYNKHIHTIAHATKPKQYGKARVIPTAYDIKGGGSWFDNGKNIITVDFPDKTKTYVDLYISKTKPESVGKPGAVINKLFLDVARGRYYEDISGNRAYSHQYKDLKVVEQQMMDFSDVQQDAPF